MNFRTYVKGLRETQKNLEKIITDLSGHPILETMGKAVLLVEGKAKKNAPVDRGPLRASITPEISRTANIVQGVVGSALVYAPFQELGTPPFWPPWKPLYQWARRKVGGDLKAAGALAASARRAIARRGIIAKRFLQNAFESSKSEIIRIFDQTVKRIIG